MYNDVPGRCLTYLRDLFGFLMTQELIAAVLTGAEHVNRIIVFAVNIVLENSILFY